MPKINITSSDLKSQFIKTRNKEQDVLKRYCGNCKKEYSFDDVTKRYPTLIQDSITTLWKNSEIDFYCSYCHLLKLVRLINNNKKNH